MQSAYEQCYCGTVVAISFYNRSVAASILRPYPTEVVRVEGKLRQLLSSSLSFRRGYYGNGTVNAVRIARPDAHLMCSRVPH